ncbi:MAG: PqqD family protein, partial [Gaiellaceae bacterium]
MAPVMREGLRVERTADEFVVVDQTTGAAHALDETAAAVLALCDGSTSVEAMAEQLTASTGASVTTSVVEATLVELARADLIRGALATPIDPSQLTPSAEGLSRRQVMRRTGVIAAALAAVPVIGALVRPATGLAGTPTPPPATTRPPRSAAECILDLNFRVAALVEEGRLRPAQGARLILPLNLALFAVKGGRHRVACKWLDV